MASGAIRELIAKVKFELDNGSLSRVHNAIQNVKNKLAGIEDKTVKLKVKASTGKVTALTSALQSLRGKTINIRVRGASTGKITALNNALSSLRGRSVSVSVQGAEATRVYALRDALRGLPSNTSVTVSVNSAGIDDAINKIRELKDALNGMGNLNAALANLHLSLSSMTVTASSVTVNGGNGSGGNGDGSGGGNGGGSGDGGSGGRLRHLADHGMEIAGLGTAITAPLGYAVKEAMSFESAMADVRKVVDFDTEDQFKGMKDDILELSTKIPMTAEEIAQMVAAGGQSSIEKDSLLDFAESAAKMGVAFDVSAEKAGKAMAQMRTMFGLNQKEVESLSDAINHLGNNTASESKDILEVVRRVGSVAQTGGLTAVDVAGLGAAIVGVGAAPEVASTAIQKMVTQLMAPNSSKATAEAFGAIGFRPSELAPMMIKDAKSTLLTVFKRIGQLDLAEQTSVLSGIFGNESLESIAPLLTKLENLENAWGLVADETQYAESMQAEYDARAGTSENSLELLKNRIDALAKSLGDSLTPAMNRVLETIGPLIKSVSDFAKEHPNLTAGILGAVAALGGLLVGLGGVGLALSGVISAVEVLGPVIGGIGGFFASIPAMITGALGGAVSFIMGIPGMIAGAFTSAVGVASSIMSMGLTGILGAISTAIGSLVASFISLLPVILPIVAVITAIASAIYYAYEHWDELYGYFAWSMPEINTALEKIKTAWDMLQPSIERLIPLVAFVGEIIGGALWWAIKRVWDVGVKCFEFIAEAINTAVWAVNSLIDVLGPLINWLNQAADAALRFFGLASEQKVAGAEGLARKAWNESHSSSNTDNSTQNFTFNVRDYGQAHDAMDGILGSTQFGSYQ